MTKISIQINEELRKKLKVIALEKNITLNEVIVRAIKLKLQELEYDRSF
jgi:predicted HicB family RNase H-like nuclease